jgi:hypothetical protein
MFSFSRRTVLHGVISRINKSIKINFMDVIFPSDCENFFDGVIVGCILIFEIQQDESLWNKTFLFKNEVLKPNGVFWTYQLVRKKCRTKILIIFFEINFSFTPHLLRNILHNSFIWCSHFHMCAIWSDSWESPLLDNFNNTKSTVNLTCSLYNICNN